jgi:hypothetical protein
MIGYIFALLPIYVLLYLPLQHMLYGSTEDALKFRGTRYNASLIASDEPLSCPPHKYNTFVVSRKPLIIYIENFLSPEESKHLLDLRYSPLGLFVSAFPAFRRISNQGNHVTNSTPVKANMKPRR